jgi:PadR family transcriptional regulator, regulatory protein PadR
MAPRVKLSAQTLAVLRALVAEPSRWRHGYDLASETGLKSGSLYPILARLADREMVEARWEEEQPVGRPRRHMYRLTADGLSAASVALTAESRASQASARAAVRRLAGESS